jgi:hypothetical protein
MHNTGGTQRLDETNAGQQKIFDMNVGRLAMASDDLLPPNPFISRTEKNAANAGLCGTRTEGTNCA